MKTSRSKVILYICSLAFVFGGCKNYDNTNAADGNGRNSAIGSLKVVPKDDVEELGKIIKLPLAPLEAIWNDGNLSSDANADRAVAPAKKLLIVLKFSTEDAAQIETQAAKYQRADAAVIDVEDWFPAELVAQSQLAGDETLKGVTYAANDFFQEPYTDGKLTRIANTDYFVLELNAK